MRRGRNAASYIEINPMVRRGRTLPLTAGYGWFRDRSSSVSADCTGTISCRARETVN